MTDVLSITVPIGSRYASVNNVGGNSHRGGKKSPEYRRLFNAVQSAAEAEIERTGWTKATSECAAYVVRYVSDRRRRDATNAFKCEADALTEAGVWDDDNLVNPFLSTIRYDTEGENRVTIVIVKLYQSVPGPVTHAGLLTSRQPRTAPSWQNCDGSC